MPVCEKIGTAIGAQASAQGKIWLLWGAGSCSDWTRDTVSVGNTTAQRQIVNMAAEDISTNTSTDAINGSSSFMLSVSQ
ncbi:hypothetical protein MJ568_18880 [Escherichia coli]|nr:hypothetical protein MJ568_18880 [Escherichia coli]